MILPEEQGIGLRTAEENDFEVLLALRIVAMRPSLERIGRYDAARARDRFRAGFDAGATRHIVLDGRDVGFFVLKTDRAPWLLDHLYLLPEAQGRGVGAAVLARLFSEADRAAAALRVGALRVGALRGSDANRFYQRHGFVQVAEQEWDIYYLRAPRPGAA